MDWSGQLRKTLHDNALVWAERGAVEYYLSLGSNPTVLFEQAADNLRHGNFHPNAWRAIARNPEWNARLQKLHSQRKALPPAKAANARELDSSNSSDALLMNCFCFPRAAKRIFKALDIRTASEEVAFGFKAQVPLVDGGEDATEVDMRAGSHLFEAKLTEKNFTSKPKAHVERYRDLAKHFDVEALPSDGEDFVGYQLIRNVLAAAHHDASLTVLIDQRRPDLLEEWWRVHSAIRSTSLRRRCGFRTWQQVAAVSPAPLREFLSVKYGL